MQQLETILADMVEQLENNGERGSFGPRKFAKVFDSTGSVSGLSVGDQAVIAEIDRLPGYTDTSAPAVSAGVKIDPLRGALVSIPSGVGLVLGLSGQPQVDDAVIRGNAVYVVNDQFRPNAVGEVPSKDMRSVDRPLELNDQIAASSGAPGNIARVGVVARLSLPTENPCDGIVVQEVLNHGRGARNAFHLKQPSKRLYDLLMAQGLDAGGRAGTRKLARKLARTAGTGAAGKGRGPKPAPSFQGGNERHAQEPSPSREAARPVLRIVASDSSRPKGVSTAPLRLVP